MEPVSTSSEMVPRRGNGTFAPGAVANAKGRPAGTPSGRTAALRLLDKVLSEAGNQETLEAALAEHLRDDPVRFFRQIVMPLLPVEARHEVTAVEPGRIVWQSLAEAFPTQKKTTES